MQTTTTAFWKKAAAIATALVVGLGGGVALASDQFSDVPNSNIFHDEINFLAQRNITLGCGGGNYCPKANVTREQMAAFLQRTAQALSPEWDSNRDSNIGDVDNACIVGPFTSDFASVAILDGSLFGRGSGSVDGYLMYRTNGGSWQPMIDSTSGTDSSQSLSGSASISITGELEMSHLAGTYEFSVRKTSLPLATTPNNGCRLQVVVHHQMS